MRYAILSILRKTSMSMYCTGTLDTARNAPAGIRWTRTMTLLIDGRMRSGVCGQRGSGGNAFSVAAEAMPARSAPSSSARRFTAAESGAPVSGTPRVRARKGIRH